MLEKIAENMRMIFGRRDRYSDTVERVEESTHQHRREATNAIDDLLRELTTTRKRGDGEESSR